jgi:hypothetical protein
MFAFSILCSETREARPFSTEMTQDMPKSIVANINDQKNISLPDPNWWVSVGALVLLLA